MTLGERESRDLARGQQYIDDAVWPNWPRYDDRDWHRAMAEMIALPTNVYHLRGRSWLLTNCATCRNIGGIYVDPEPPSTTRPWILCPDCHVVEMRSYGGRERETYRKIGQGPDCPELFDLPTDHGDGLCFACSGIAEPKRAAPSGERFALRIAGMNRGDA